MKKLLIVLGIVVIIGVILVSSNTSKAPTTETLIQEKAAEPAQDAPTEAIATSTNITETEAKKPDTTSKPKAGEYTIADVSKHADSSSCWSAVNGNVYDLTQWIGGHPGGEKAVLSICGKDGSAAFTGQHGGDQKPESVLAKFKIGVLVK